MPYESDAIRDNVMKHFKKLGVDVKYNIRVKELTSEGIVDIDGHLHACNVPIWATGAEAQPVCGASDLDLLRGYIQVNKYLQSTSYENVFAGGDCISFENNKDGPVFPPKAGVYAVREGPFIAENVNEFIRASAEGR